MSQRWRDLAVAVLAIGADTVLFTGLSQADEQVGWAGPQPAWLIVAAGVVAVPVLATRRSTPLLVCLAMSLYALLITATLGFRPVVSILVALYGAAVLCRRSQAVLGLAAVLTAHTVAVAYEGSFPGVTAGDVALIAVVYLLLDLSTWSGGRWGAGAAARARARDLEEERDRLAEEAVAEERLRIARELHDIVAHAVTAMTLQAAGAQRVLASDPERASQSMQTVELLGRQAIAEMRRLLSVMRAADGLDTATSIEHGISEIPDLVGSAQENGAVVELTSSGKPIELDPSVGLTAYRLVQEALTNAAKHAPANAVTIATSWRHSELHLEVINDLSHTGNRLGSEMPSGYGLVGLAERVRLVGGTLAAGAGSDGRFVIEATLPAAATPAAAGAEPQRRAPTARR